MNKNRRDGFYWLLIPRFKGDRIGEWIVGQWTTILYGRTSSWLLPGTVNNIQDDFFLEIGEEVIR
jgi:hypothetical protein